MRKSDKLKKIAEKEYEKESVIAGLQQLINITTKTYPYYVEEEEGSWIIPYSLGGSTGGGGCHIPDYSHDSELVSNGLEIIENWIKQIRV